MAAGELKPKRGVFSRLPAWLKAAVVKAWFGGAVFYFIGWGLFIQTADSLDLTVALGLALGLVTELLVNKILLFLESGAQEYRKFIFCDAKRLYALFVNVLYGVALSFCIAYTYHGFNFLAQQWAGQPPGYITLGGEPILFGLLFMGYDILFARLKHLIFRKDTKK